MESVFPFGCRYAEDFPRSPDEWEQDMKLMRYLHFNTIRVPLVWGVMEPVRSGVDFAFLDSFLDLAEKYSLRVIFSFNFHGAPEWACRRHPSYRYMDAKGNYINPSSSHEVPSGGWPGLCPDHTEVRTLEARFISTVCRHTGGRVWGWDPCGESSGVAAPGETTLSGMTCYCPTTCRHFREWVLKKYRDFRTAGEAWAMPLDCNDAIRPPTGEGGSIQLMTDWRTFTAERIAYTFSRRAAIIRISCGGRIIGSSPFGGSAAIPNSGVYCFDDWKNASGTDQWGVSSPMESRADAVGTVFAMAGARGASQGHAFWQTGLGADTATGALVPAAPVSNAVFIMRCWDVLTSGAHGFLFDGFRKHRSGYGCGLSLLTDCGGNLTSIASEAKKIGQVIEDFGYTFMSGTAARAKAAILYSPSSRLLEFTRRGNSFFSLGSMKGTARALHDGSIPFDILHEETVSKEKLSEYAILILPAVFTLPEQVVELFDSYIKDGGTVLADPALCMWDSRKQFSRKLPGMGLHTLFGAEGTDTPLAAPDHVVLRRGGNRYEIRGARFIQKWKNVNAGVWADYETGGPAVLVNPSGRGRTILTGIDLGAASLSARGTPESNAAASLIRSFAEFAGAEPPVRVPLALRAGLLNAKHADILTISDTAGNGGHFSISCSTAKDKRWRSVTSKERGCFSGGMAELDFAPYETKVLFIEK